jgi:hypothetical protein
MSDITLELDMTTVTEGPWEVADMRDLGVVMVELVSPHGPGASNPVARVTGSQGAVIVWLLQEYLGAAEVGDLVLDALKPLAEGGARVTG